MFNQCLTVPDKVTARALGRDWRWGIALTSFDPSASEVRLYGAEQRQ